MSATPLLSATSEDTADVPLSYHTVLGGPLDEHRLSRRQHWGGPNFVRAPAHRSASSAGELSLGVGQDSKASAGTGADSGASAGAGADHAELNGGVGPARMAAASAPGARARGSRRDQSGAHVDGAASLAVSVASPPPDAGGLPPLGPTASLEPLTDTGVDPFENETPWSCYEVFKTVIVGVTLFPVRLAVLISSLLIGWVFVALSGACLTADAAARRPFGCGRKCLKVPMAYVCRIIMWCLGFWWIKRKRSRSKVKAGVIVSNHVSLNDVFYHIWASLPSALSKLSVASLPIVSSGAKAMQTIFIDRKSARSRNDGLELLRARAADARYPPILIFPEGTTTNGQCLIDFKRGAFVPGVPVKPVVLKYPSHHYNPADTGRHSGNKSLFWLMLQFANWIEITELDTYVPTQQERDNPLLFARNVRAVMAKVMKVPVTDHSYHDYLSLFDLARAAKIPQTFTLYECRSKYGLSASEVAAVMSHWRELDEDGDGLLQLSEVKSLLLAFATPQQQHDGVVLKAALAAYRCATSPARRVPEMWAEAEPQQPSGHSMRFDFPTVVHARGLMFGNTVGFGTRHAPNRVAAATAAAEAARGDAAAAGVGAAPSGAAGAVPSDAGTDGNDGEAWAAPRASTAPDAGTTTVDGSTAASVGSGATTTAASGGAATGGVGYTGVAPAAGSSNRVFPASAAVAPMRA